MRVFLLERAAKDSVEQRVMVLDEGVFNDTRKVAKEGAEFVDSLQDL